MRIEHRHIRMKNLIYVFLNFSDLRFATSEQTGTHMKKLIYVFLNFSGFRGVT